MSQNGTSIKKAYLLCGDAILFAVLLFIDQWTKYLTVIRLKGSSAHVLIDGVLELQYLENRGSAFGMLQGQKFLILAIDMVFMAVILFFLLKLPRKQNFIRLHVLFVMLMAGGIGNMIDRIRLDYVIDFISFVLINYPIFNVADIYIVTASVILFILFVFVYKEEDLAFLDRNRKGAGRQSDE